MHYASVRTIISVIELLEKICIRRKELDLSIPYHFMNKYYLCDSKSIVFYPKDRVNIRQILCPNDNSVVIKDSNSHFYAYYDNIFKIMRNGITYNVPMSYDELFHLSTVYEDIEYIIELATTIKGYYFISLEHDYDTILDSLSNYWDTIK